MPAYVPSRQCIGYINQEERRYIDDCFIITSTLFEMDVCFRPMYEQSQYIKLTREIPHNNWLPHLNTRVKVSKAVVSVRWYREGGLKDILVHATSAHPQAVKRAGVNKSLTREGS
ncbi:hypothetical protein V3C99_002930 [Haemonchus contortus]